MKRFKNVVFQILFSITGIQMSKTRLQEKKMFVSQNIKIRFDSFHTEMQMRMMKRFSI